MLAAIPKLRPVNPIIALVVSRIEIVLGTQRRVAIVCSGGANSKKTALVLATFGVKGVSAVTERRVTALMWTRVVMIWIAGLIDAAMRRCVGSMRLAIRVSTTVIVPLKVCVRSSNVSHADLYLYARLCAESGFTLG